MVQALSWVALGLSSLALAQASLQARRAAPSPALPRGPLFAALAFLILGALLTLPVQAPWSSGQTLAPGLLLGGASVLVSALLCARLAGAGERSPALAGSVQAAAAALGVGVLVLFYSARVLDALGGFSLGAVATALLLTAAHGSLEPVLVVRIRTAAFTSALVAATTLLATYHRSPADLREWQPLPVLLTATLAASLAVGAGLASPVSAVSRRFPPVAGPAIVAALLLAMAWLIGYRLHGTPAFFQAALLGLAGFGVLAILDATSDSDGGPLRADAALVTALLVLGTAVLAFRQLHGFGLGVALLAGSGVAAALPPRASGPADRPRLNGALVLGLLLLLYRVFEQRLSYVRSPEPDFFYYHVGLVAGALLPALLAGFLGPRETEPPPTEPGLARGEAASLPVALSRVGLAGCLAALAPLVVWLLVGPRPQAAFLVGLGIGAAFLLALRTRGSDWSGAGLLAAGMLFSAVQFTPLLAPLALWTRGQRIGLLVAVGAAAVVWIALNLWLDRRATPAQPLRQDAAGAV